MVSWNVERNGLSSGADGRWHLAMDILAALKPHILLRQELRRADMHGERALWAEAARLGGHTPFLADATRESANPTGVYTDPGLCQPTEYRQSWAWPACGGYGPLLGTAGLAADNLLGARVVLAEAGSSRPTTTPNCCGRCAAEMGISAS
ncbi:hypothetical protein AB0M05_47935 [Streptomyces violaceusniger]|uniref:hypothetical protein n=1 Tax=Streptomyces violaceusniger TaxID=68280 RepID=UPI003420EB43